MTPLGTMASKYGHGSGDMSSFYGAAQRVSCRNRPFPRCTHVGQRENGRSGGKKLTAMWGLWAVLGGIPSGWEQFGAEKKWAVVIGGLRRQLNALYCVSKMAQRPSGYARWRGAAGSSPAYSGQFTPLAQRHHFSGAWWQAWHPR